MIDRQLSLFPDADYHVGVTKDADDDLWTSAGFGGDTLAHLLGLNNPYRVTGKQALEQAAALICLDVLSQDISKATLRLKEVIKKGGEIVVDPTKHHIARMLALEPNSRHTWVEFIGMLVYHLGMACNSYAYVQRTGDGTPLGLIPAMPQRVMERINERSGETFYDITAASVQEAALLGAYDITAPERDVLHIRQRMLDGFWGYATLDAGGRTLSLSRDIEMYERHLFGEGGKIRGVFVRNSDKGEMSDAVFRRVKGQLKKLMQRVRDENDPILLEDGITYKDIAMKANEAEMTKALDKQIEMVCKLWRMPPHKAMHLTAVKYENLTAMEMVYVRDTLIPICRLVEQRLNKTLLTPEERLRFKFEFDRDEMKIADEKAENERVAKLVGIGLISHNEGRADQGYNPRKGGNVYTVPANTKLVDEDGNTVVTGAKETPPPADPPEEPPDEGKGGPPLRLAVSN